MPSETTRQKLPLTQNSELVALKEIGLRYVSCTDKGYCRIKKGKTFHYLDAKGRPVTDEQTLKRIKALVLPPAWQEVWICTKANGHLQATGLDVRKRKQYRYHPGWVKLRSEKKFNNLLPFGVKLPMLRKQLAKDLRKKAFGKEKVCALAVAVMDKTSFRAGNKSYEKENGSYGLTTLRNKHVKQMSKSKLFFKFVGKKGVLQQTYLKEAGLVKLLLKVKEIPGQRIFQYYNEAGEVRGLDSGDINDYLKQAMQIDVSCKNFRTWNGCLLALASLLDHELAGTQAQRKKNSLLVIDEVAKRLGNTRTVTRSHYIHPRILSEYEDGALDKWIKKMQNADDVDRKAALQKQLFKILKAK